MLPQEFKTLYYKVLLGEEGEIKLTEKVKENKNALAEIFNIENEMDNHILSSFKKGKINYLLIKILFRKYIDLKLLDELRLKQISQRKEMFVEIGEILNCQAWLSGSTSIEYKGTDNQNHFIDINFPFQEEEKLKILASDVIGGIYFDKKLIPFNSQMEKDCIRNLNSIQIINEDLKAVIDFLNSNKYLDLAKRLGRI